MPSFSRCHRNNSSQRVHTQLNAIKRSINGAEGWFGKDFFPINPIWRAASAPVIFIFGAFSLHDQNLCTLVDFYCTASTQTRSRRDRWLLLLLMMIAPRLEERKQVNSVLAESLIRMRARSWSLHQSEMPPFAPATHIPPFSHFASLFPSH